jgi:hypothetical protein
MPDHNRFPAGFDYNAWILWAFPIMRDRSGIVPLADLIAY